MALNAGTVWEVRATGNAANGGGFYNRSPGTSVDYSQQDAAQLTLTDLATDGAGTGLSSATGGFTAAMIGNIIRISGGTLTAGWYEITGHTSGNAVTIDRTAGASKTGGTGNVGGAFAFGTTLDSDRFAATVGGNVIWIKGGNHALGETIAVKDMSAPNNLIVEGFNTVRGDTPTGDNRPFIDCGIYYFGLGSRNIARHLRFTGTGLYVVDAGGSNNKLYNIKAVNPSLTANRIAINIETTSVWLCEAVSTLGLAFSSTTGDNQLMYCYAHDSNVGMNVDRAFGCVIDTCTTAGFQTVVAAVNNTVYNCGTGIAQGAMTASTILNNIVTGCPVGISATAANNNHNLDGNCWNNTTDFSNITAGPTDLVATDPLLVDPANGDFTLGSGSPCFGAGVTLDARVGL